MNWYISIFRQLQDFFVSNNRINDLSCLPNVVPKLEVLDLTDNEISDWDELVSVQFLLGPNMDWSLMEILSCRGLILALFQSTTANKLDS